MMARLKLWTVGFAVVVAALASSWFKGRKSAKAAAKIVELQDYVETRERMDEVGRMSDADASREWLRDRDK